MTRSRSAFISWHFILHPLGYGAFVSRALSRRTVQRLARPDARGGLRDLVGADVVVAPARPTDFVSVAHARVRARHAARRRWMGTPADPGDICMHTWQRDDDRDGAGLGECAGRRR